MRIQFSHGNGFPAGSYRPYLDALRTAIPGLDLRALERIGHDPRYPVTDKWPNLVAELAAQLDDARDRPVTLIGHSLGGYLSLMAAYRLGASRVAAVVMLDSPIVPAWKATVLAFAKKFGFDERFSPAGGVRRRRDTWPDRGAAFEHFKDKPLFARFGPEALDHYIQSGVAISGGGAQLAFDREREYRIYRTLPHHLHRLTRQPPPCPVGFLGGTLSRELRLTGPEATRRLVGPRFDMIEGGHLFPMERPGEAAERTRAMLAAMGALT